ncbi:MAG: hypothetical protein R2830_11955 [Saprospiraceae bacterium]
MKAFLYSSLLALSIFAISCQPTDAEHPALAQSNMQEKPVAVAAKTTPDYRAGKRNAEEMVAAGFKRYGIEKGIFTFRLYGAVTGYEVLYFDNWGWREGRYIRTTADVGAYKEKTNKVQYLNGERRYEYDPETKIAHFFDSPQIQASADKYNTQDMTIVNDEMIKRMGGVAVGKDKVKGVECEVWRIENIKTTLCMAYGITMREESFASGIPVSRVAISVKTDVEVPEDKMTVPDGAEEVDINARK